MANCDNYPPGLVPLNDDACCYPWYMGISLPVNELLNAQKVTGTLGS